MSLILPINRLRVLKLVQPLCPRWFLSVSSVSLCFQSVLGQRKMNSSAQPLDSRAETKDAIRCISHFAGVR